MGKLTERCDGSRKLAPFTTCVRTTVDKLHVGSAVVYPPGASPAEMMRIAQEAVAQEQSCSLKKHFSGCVRQVVGYLELLAKKNAWGFVFCTVDNIVEHCRKYSPKDAESDDTYGRSQVLRVLKFLREIHVISPYHLREIPGFGWRRGFVVVDHDAVARRGYNRSKCHLLVHKAEFHSGNVGVWLTPESERRLAEVMQKVACRDLQGTYEQAACEATNDTGNDTGNDTEGAA